MAPPGREAAPPGALLLPGRGYGTAAPLLHYTTLVLRNRGWVVHPLQWDPPPEGAEEVRRRTRAALRAHEVRPALIAGKSLGTLSLPVAADLDIPGIWLTPVLTDKAVADALPGLTAPTLLVGGTADDLWDSGRARTGDPDVVRVLEVPEADHSLEIPGDELASVDVLRLVVARIADFLDEQW